MPRHVTRIGVVSDTHGYLDPAVLEVFAGVDHIIHAGDVMDAGILEALRAVAPLTAVHGNLDDGELRRPCRGRRAARWAASPSSWGTSASDS